MLYRDNNKKIIIVLSSSIYVLPLILSLTITAAALKYHDRKTLSFLSDIKKIILNISLSYIGNRDRSSRSIEKL